MWHAEFFEKSIFVKVKHTFFFFKIKYSFLFEDFAWSAITFMIDTSLLIVNSVSSLFNFLLPNLVLKWYIFTWKSIS